MSNLKFIQIGDSFNANGLNVVWLIIGLITIYAGIKNLLDKENPSRVGILPLTHYLAVQGECWILNSPLDHVFTRLAPLALLIVVPMAAGLPILGVRLRAWSSKDPEKDRIRTLLVKESLITDETQGGAR